MKIENGKSYRTRGGTIVNVLTNQVWQVNSNLYPFVSYKDGEVFEWYTREGTVHQRTALGYPAASHIDDLMEEVEPQIEVDLSVPEAVHTVVELDEEGRIAVWQAYLDTIRFNRSHTVDDLIAARVKIQKA